MSITRMLSLTKEDAEWLIKNDVSPTLLLRRAIGVCRDVDKTNIEEVVHRLRLVNDKLNDLLAAYQMDASTIKEVVR